MARVRGARRRLHSPTSFDFASLPAAIAALTNDHRAMPALKDHTLDMDEEQSRAMQLLQLAFTVMRASV